MKRNINRLAWRKIGTGSISEPLLSGSSINRKKDKAKEPNSGFNLRSYSLNGLLFIMMLLIASVKLTAQTSNCTDPGATFTITNTGQSTTSGGATFTTMYVVVSVATNQIVNAASSSTTITAPTTPGSYLVYAVNYQTSGGAVAPTLTIGTLINAIGGTCAAVSTSPVHFTVCDCTTGGSSVTFTNVNQNTTSGYSTVYVLTNSAGIIQLSSSTSPLTVPTSAGEYAIYAVNYQTGATNPTVTAGTNINAIGGTCVAKSLYPVYLKVCPTISGTVFNDVNGLSDNTVNGTGLGNPSSTPLYANLLNGTNNVVATTPVNANGTYSFADVAPATYGVQVSTVQGTVSSPAPATTLPTNWVSTGENLGTTAGNDGTVNGILTPVTVSNTNVTDANFGIEQLPTPANLTAASQPNPGGTVNAPVPATTFGATDPDGGTVTNIKITALPTNATSITINGTPYTSGFPVTVPTNAAGEPTQPILVDPIDGAVVVDIPYSATDNADKESPATGVAHVPFGTVGISGTVFNDVNGLSDNTVNGTGLGNPSSTPLYANLLNGTNNVVATTPVNANGTFSFADVAPATYGIQVSTVQGTVSSPAPATSLPSNWVSTGENLGTTAGNDGTVNGILTPVTVSNTNVTDANFGIEQLPTPANLTAASQPNPGGTVNAPVPATTFGATDPDGGTVTNIKITALPTNATSITINGTPYTSGFPVTVPTNAAGEPTQPILVDPIDGAVVVDIPYSATDNADKESPATGVAHVPFGTVGISGTVFNDVNGLSDNTVNGTGLGNPNSTPLYANLLSGANNVVATTPVNANGTYSFADVAPATYGVQVSTVQGTVSSPAPATTLPTNWVSTGENLGTTAGNDGTVNGILTPVTVSNTNVTDANFGIEQLPTPANLTAASQPNPGGTVNAPVPATTFGATDPDGGTVTNIKITALPTNATSITINGTPYTSGFPVTVPTNAAGEPTQPILVDPIDGAVVVDIPYSATDNADKESPATGVAHVPFGTVGISGTVFNDVNGLSDNTVNGTGLGNPSSTPLYANLLNGTNNVVATTPVNASGTYSFPQANPGTYSIQVSTVQGTVSSPAPATSLPSNWVSTGENLGTTAGNDGTVNGILTPVTVSNTNVTDANFGIEQLPTPANLTAASQPNPGGTVNAPVPATTFGATDPDGGTVTNIKVTALPTNATSITINGTPYTSGFPVTVPTNAAGEPTQPILVDPIDGAVVVDIPYSATDNADKESPATGVAHVPFGTVGISGTVFNDVNGLSDNTVNGTGLGNPSSTPLYANLLNGTNNVVATTPVNANGTYSFPQANPGTYSVQVSTVQGTVSSPAPATTLPTNWVSTGENLGTTTGNDGTVNGILTPVTVSNTNVTDANFGIEQLPTPANLTAASQPNPGGTVNVTVPPTTFGATDPDGGTVTNIKITALPTNATSITINGTPYTSGFPVTVPTNAAGEPTQPILVDPIDGAVVVGIPYSAVDNAGKESPATGLANVPFGTVGISGTVFNDVNGLSDNTVNGTGLGNPSSTPLYANLLNGTNNVVATTPVNANGTYSFPQANPGTYSVQVSTVQGTVSSPAPATTLPTNWVSTGENLGTTAGNDGTVNGILTPVTVSNTNVTDANFGIEQLPTPANLTAASQPNPGGTVNAPVPATTFGATDPDGGTVTNIKITALPTNATSITINGTPYTSGFPVTVPTNAAGEPTQPILVDPIDGAVVVGIPYSAVDNAGKESPATGLANVPFGTVGISGTVFNDVNGLSDNTVNGTGLGNPSSTPLYANLLNGTNNVVATTPVNANGTYSFPQANPGTYSVQVSTVQGTVSSPAPATSLPSNWVSTGENLGTTAGNDGTVNGILTPVTVSNTNVTDANFGIEQLPTPANLTAASQPNPGGTVNAPVPATTFGATDPDGGTVTNIKITALPTNATSITINGTPYTSGFPVTVPTNAAGEPTQPILVDPIDGVVVVGIPYSAVDNAGKESPATGLANVPFGTVGISGTVFNDVNGLSDNTVNGTGLGNPSSTPLYANLLNGTNNVVATTPVNTNGTYSFPQANPGTYSVQVSTVQGTVSSPAPATSLPTNWVTTGENLGTSAGNDGTVNGILTPIAVSNANVTNANFGIEQLPTPSTLIAAGHVNPGGTVSVAVPATTFASTDPDGGTVTNIKITALPTNATSITINGTPYTSGFPVTVPTNAAGEPIQAILIDPIEGSVTVSIPYVSIDNANKESILQGAAKMPFTTPNPDVNATFVNIPLAGDVNTNDVIIPGSTYSNPVPNPSNPGTALPLIASDGTYTFTSPIAGTFIFFVPVTSPGGGITPVQLLIVVINASTNTNPPIANTDIASTLEVTPVTLGTLLNDACGNAGCSLNPASVTVIDPPNHGGTIVNPGTGDVLYTPQAGFTGTDTLTYQVADNSVPPNITTALQIITVVPTNGPNTTSAADDYKTAPYNTTVYGNVKLNDNDPQNHTQSVTPQTTTIPGKGTLQLTASGSYTFTPVGGFVGPVEYPYITTDNGSPVASAEATLHILTASGIVFPVVMSEFTAEENNCDVLLKWTTEQELNSSHFNVMRKRNNELNYTLIAKVKAQGNSTTQINYSYLDTKADNGNNAYYLETVDIDQKSELSETKTIRLNCGGSLSIYPNPATDQIHLTILSANKRDEENLYEIRMTDIAGRTVAQEKYQASLGSQTIDLPCAHLAAGQYHITVSNQHEVQTLKVQVSK